MVSRRSVLSLLRRGLGYREVAERLGIGPGLAYLIATGASATDGVAGEPDLVFPAPRNPTRRPEVWAWAADRARTDWQMTAAARD